MLESDIKIEQPYHVNEKNYWLATHNTISVKKNYQEDDAYLNKSILKHEIKHLKNKDNIKKAPLLGGTVGLATFVMNRQPILTIPVVLIGYAANMSYWKYFESEADRFAHEHAVDRKEIEAAQHYFLNKRQSDINDVLDLSDAIDSIEKKLDGNMSYYDRLKEKSRLKLFKTILKNPEISVDILHFINDRHPSPKNRAIMAKNILTNGMKNITKIYLKMI